MKKIDFDKYSTQSIHFFSHSPPMLLSNVVKNLDCHAVIIDVGCGDGHLISTLSETGLFKSSQEIIGVDLSPIRLERFKELTGFRGILANGQRMHLIDDNSSDLTISTMVIEHVPDDHEYAKELARITRPGGLLYISTVIRKKWAWYFRKAPDGRRVLDSTHLREYPSPESVLELITAAGFTIKAQRISRLSFPIAHPIVRTLNTFAPIKEVQRLFLRNPYKFLEKLALPIPRYRSIEIVAQKPKQNI